MRRILPIITAIVCLLTVFSCKKQETYGEQKKKERNAIEDFINAKGINVITEETFVAQGNKTNGNEYVYLNNSGVYMHITRQGAGTPIQDKESNQLYIRFLEINLSDTTKAITNRYIPYDPDIMNVSREGTTITATFSYGVMLTSYGSSVPAGWLVPLSYINVGIPTADEDIALVNLIVPHTQGHTVASGNVCPYYYEISFQRSPGS